MDKFDKLFQDKLNQINENDFEFKESSWERFHNDFETENVTSKRVVSLVWLKRNAVAAAIVLLLLMSNVFFAKQFLNTRSDVKALSETVETLKSEIIVCQENLAFAGESGNKNKNRNENSNANQNADDLTTTFNENENKSENSKRKIPTQTKMLMI
ncbi:MAG: hypothetical protein HC803_06480 [Saprospiraceae bacterium]|nr:hypothetical protein [Saprospiraceae bacterium]